MEISIPKFFKKEPVMGSHGKRIESDPYAFQVAHRRLAWMYRLTTGCLIAALIVIAVLVSAFKQLLPLKTTELVLIREDHNTNRMYRAEPFIKGEKSGDVAMEAMAVRYVRLMLEIDRVTQDERFDEAFKMTDRKFYKKFFDEHIKTERIQKALASGLTRSITIENAHKMDTKGDQDKFAIDLIQTDMRHGELVETKKLRAFVHMTTRPRTVKAEDRYENPLGIVFLDMVVKERANK